MLIHCVTIKFIPTVTSDQIASFSAAIAALNDRIDVVRTSQHGPDLGERSTNADYAIVATFENAHDFHCYLAHPAHQAIVHDHLMALSESVHSVQFVTHPTD